jgi:hypothetical protein
MSFVVVNDKNLTKPQFWSGSADRRTVGTPR